MDKNSPTTLLASSAPAGCADSQRGRFVVLYAGGLPLAFHQNLRGEVFEVATRERATRFNSGAEARQAALCARVRHFRIESESNL